MQHTYIKTFYNVFYSVIYSVFYSTLSYYSLFLCVCQLEFSIGLYLFPYCFIGSSWYHPYFSLHKLPSGAPKPLNRLSQNLASGTRPRMQKLVDFRKRGWGGGMGEVVTSRAFFLFLVSRIRPQLTLRMLAWRSMHQKTCFGGVNTTRKYQ